MVKRRVEFIENGKKRKVTYRKRKGNIMNKLMEISTLCGVEACAVINSPYQEEPEIWPPSHEAVRGVLQRFRNMPQTLQTMNALTQEDLVQKEMRKVRELLREQERKNRSEEIRAAISQMLQHGPGLLYQMSVEDFNDTVLALQEMQRHVDENLSKCGGGGNDGLVENKQQTGEADVGNFLGTGADNNSGDVMGIEAANQQNVIWGGVGNNPGNLIGTGIGNNLGNVMWAGAANVIGTGDANVGNFMWNGAANVAGTGDVNPVNVMWTGAANQGHFMETGATNPGNLMWTRAANPENFMWTGASNPGNLMWTGGTNLTWTEAINQENLMRIQASNPGNLMSTGAAANPGNLMWTGGTNLTWTEAINQENLMRIQASNPGNLMSTGAAANPGNAAGDSQRVVHYTNKNINP